MKRSYVCAWAAALMLMLMFTSSSPARAADDPAEVGLEVSAQAAALLPLAGWGELSGPLLGAFLMARYEVPVEGLAARARLGAMFGIPVRRVTTYAAGGELVIDARTDAIPLLIGADYALPVENLSAHGEIGLAIVNESGSGRANGQVVRTSNQRVGLTIDIGATYDLGVVRVGLDVTLADLGGEPILPGAMLTVGLPFYRI